MKTLIQITPDFMTKGIFHFMQSLHPPWYNLNIEHDLDFEYYGNRSGNKSVSPLFTKLLYGYDVEETTDTIQLALARVCLSLNAKRWQGLYDTMNQQYNPIENYNMVEEKTGEYTDTYGKTITRTDNLANGNSQTVTDNLTETDNSTRTDNLTQTKQGSDITATTETKTGTDTTTPDVTDETTSDIYGYNSETATHANKETKTTTGDQTIEYNTTIENTETKTINETETNTGTQTNNTTKTNTGTKTIQDSGTQTGTQTNAYSGDDVRNEEYELTRHGNIGVTTTQQMLEQERNLWIWDYFAHIFRDVDKILTVSHYEIKEGVCK